MDELVAIESIRHLDEKPRHYCLLDGADGIFLSEARDLRGQAEVEFRTSDCACSQQVYGGVAQPADSRLQERLNRPGHGCGALAVVARIADEFGHEKGMPCGLLPDCLNVNIYLALVDQQPQVVGVEATQLQDLHPGKSFQVTCAVAACDEQPHSPGIGLAQHLREEGPGSRVGPLNVVDDQGSGLTGRDLPYYSGQAGQ